MQTTRHRGGRSSGVSQLLFVGVLAMLGTQTMAEDKFKVEAYDCSQPMNIKMFDREAHCRFNPGVEGVPVPGEGLNPPARELVNCGWIQMPGYISQKNVLLWHVLVFKANT